MTVQTDYHDDYNECSVVDCHARWIVMKGEGVGVCAKHYADARDKCDVCQKMADVRIEEARWCVNCWLGEGADDELCEQDDCFNAVEKSIVVDGVEEARVCTKHAEARRDEVEARGGVIEDLAEIEWSDDPATVNREAVKQVNHAKDDWWEKNRGTYSVSGVGYAAGQGMFKQCYHSGRAVIYTTSDGITLAGARGFDIDGFAADLIIDLAGHVKLDNGDWVDVDKAESPKWYALNKLVKRPTANVLRCHWADQTAPPVGLAFWVELWKLIRGAGFKRVVVACAGGHGRTGTCIASMMLADSNMKLQTVLDKIHDKHCEKAVETKSQDNYLEALVAARDAGKGKQQ